MGDAWGVGVGVGQAELERSRGTLGDSVPRVAAQRRARTALRCGQDTCSWGEAGASEKKVAGDATELGVWGAGSLAWGAGGAEQKLMSYG